MNNKIMPTLLIFFGTLLSILTLYALGISVNTLTVLISVPADLWSAKHTFLGVALIIIIASVLYFGIRLGLGSLKTGLRTLTAAHINNNIKSEVNKIIEGESKDGFKDKDQDTKRAS